jgi:hypothetical protein
MRGREGCDPSGDREGEDVSAKPIEKRGRTLWDPEHECMVVVPTRNEVIADVLALIWSHATGAELAGDTGTARALYDLHDEIRTRGVP